jgi:hypothetical protein
MLGGCLDTEDQKEAFGKYAKDINELWSAQTEFLNHMNSTENVHKLIEKGVTPEEFNDRVDALFCDVKNEFGDNAFFHESILGASFSVGEHIKEAYDELYNSWEKGAKKACHNSDGFNLGDFIKKATFNWENPTNPSIIPRTLGSEAAREALPRRWNHPFYKEFYKERADSVCYYFGYLTRVVEEAEQGMRGLKPLYEIEKSL